MNPGAAMWSRPQLGKGDSRAIEPAARGTLRFQQRANAHRDVRPCCCSAFTCLTWAMCPRNPAPRGRTAVLVYRQGQLHTTGTGAGVPPGRGPGVVRGQCTWHHRSWIVSIIHDPCTVHSPNDFRSVRLRRTLHTASDDYVQAVRMPASGGRSPRAAPPRPVPGWLGPASLQSSK
jgi:hypothetical protein